MFEKNKKSQIVILATLILISFLVFIYYLETENFYNSKIDQFSILKNIETESCNIGKESNGSYLDERFQDFEIKVENYCLNFNQICKLNITKKSSAPTNLSLLNYTHYNYSINYTWNEYTYVGRFNCT